MNLIYSKYICKYTFAMMKLQCTFKYINIKCTKMTVKITIKYFMCSSMLLVRQKIIKTYVNLKCTF